MSKHVNIFNIEMNNMTMEEFLMNFKQGFLVTPNVDHLMMLQKNNEFYEAYKSADYITADSQIVYWATRFLGNGVKEKLSGSDIFPAYCQYHKDDSDVRIFLLGAMPGIAQLAAERINYRIGRNIVVGTHSPSMNFVNDLGECDAVIDIINDSGANVLVVGLGAPKQEIWIMRHRQKLVNINTFMALGATLDFEAGTLSRAPGWVSQCGLEWLYRLTREPGRLWKRYLVRDVGFFMLLFKQKLGFYKSPF